ncbi:MAG: NAD-dependent epimerase/dehydratase family protein [Pseudomonadota bacterium]
MILLTGITGFIAKRIAHDLLAAGHTVRGSLRSPERQAEVRAAVGGDDVQDRLSFVTLDLSADDGWPEAMVGVDAVIHTASPFPMAQPKNEHDLIRPAVHGTLRALKAAQAAGVTRFILTSSTAAVVYAKRPSGHRYGAADWTEIDHPAASAYVKSKTLAERAAWEFVEKHPEMRMTVINPGLVAGRPMDSAYGTSLQLVERILAGKDPAVPDISFPVVDVADVSRYHVDALTKDATIGKRIIAAESTWSMPEMAQLLKETYPQKKIATTVAPKWLLRLIALFDPAVRGVLPSMGVRTPTDDSEARALYGATPLSGREALLASARFVVDAKG